uniref:1-acylglycerol-3-phosphate O-acyltransferase n=1 Tax=Saccoglossus kowalevskii TaxID=10224 RepID=A0ABM0MAG5_SACKO|nr:PREDICTED: 1-acyl-sn-glycerol-3-phosphate acyltransferase alpha-like [Saccoglossus kowalevskii]
MAKRSLLYAGTFGIASLLCGVIFVDRFNPKKARATIDKVVNTIKTRKTKVWMYPEGTRSAGTDKSMLPFKKGAFHIAIKAQVPIIPVVISNYKDCYDPRGHTFEQINVKVCVLPPIPTEGKTVDDVNQLTEDVWEVMLQTYNKISNNN